MSQYFPKPCNGFGGNVKVELDLFNYATKTSLKGATGIDKSNLALQSNLAKLKSEIYKIDSEKLKTFSTDLSKLRNVVDNEVVKKPVYDKLVANVNNIDTSGFVLKTIYDTDKSNLEKKVSDADKYYLILVGILKK